MINDQKRHHLTPFFDENSDALASEKLTSSKQDERLRKSKDLLEETKLVATWLYQKTENTRRGYESDIKKFFAYYKGKNLKQIESAHIVVFFKNHPELKESSKARMRSAISSLYRFLIRQRYLNFNPAEGIDPIQVPDSTHEKVLTLEEVKEMISREPNPRNKFLIELLLRTGLRVSEAVSLHNTNFRKNGESCYLSVTGKGNKTRSIRIDSELFCRAMDLSSELGGKTPVFRAKNTKKAISDVSAWKIIQKAGERIGFSNISPHWLRHTHATLSLQLGDDLRVIQHTLGHDSIVTTTKYTKVFPPQSSGQKIKL